MTLNEKVFARRSASMAQSTESLVERFHFTVRWPAIFAGALVAFVAYTLLVALGTGAAGSLGVLAPPWISGLWLVLVVASALFAGSFVAGRMGGFVPVRVGRTNGLVAAAVFFAFLFSPAGALVRSFGLGMGKVAFSLSADSESASVAAQEMMSDGLVDLNLKTAPDVVVRGLQARFERGDLAGARSYLAKQAGITRAEAKNRVEALQAQVQPLVESERGAAHSAATSAAWTLFFALAIGVAAAWAGGGWGAAANLRAPLSSLDQRYLHAS